MTLYEITNGWMGCSYVRAYVWAEDEEQARKLFLEKAPDKKNDIHSITKLFDASEPPFCTELDDEGFVRKDA